MKKTFSLESPNHKPPRVVESIKAEVRKYLKRERRKKLPEGVDFWDFDCKGGEDESSAETFHVTKITDPIDQAAANDWKSVYIEILSKPGVRSKEKAPKDSV